jgi:predicted PolB exonuclease-like 3'-5' exonuclease
MSEQRIIVFDLETVPDLAVGRLLLSADASESDEAIRLQLGQRYARDGADPKLAFIKIPLQRIVCIGALYADRADRNSHWNVTRFGAAHTGARNEIDLVRSFVESFNSHPAPQLIGFNSSSFDLPVLRYRAFHLSVAIPELHRSNGRDYWYRFGRHHMDLCDLLSNFGASAKPSLNELAALSGIPGKASGLDGAQVEAMVAADQLDQVANYCETDVLTTYLLFLRYGMITGELSAEAYRQSLFDTKTYVQTRLDRRPHLKRYVEFIAAAADLDQHPNLPYA